MPQRPFVIAVMLIISQLFVAPLHAWSEELPEGFLIAGVVNKSDDNLNAARIVCAFGLEAETQAEAVAKGGSSVDIPSYCHAVVREAVKRDRAFHLYSRMQPDKAGDEWKLILQASIANATRYVNAEGVKKELPCELAFDVGYVYGGVGAEETISPELSNDQITQMARNCFLGEDGSAVNAVIAGARLAQRDFTRD